MTLRAISNSAFSGGGAGLKSTGVLAQSAVPVSLTGTTTETVLVTVPIPAGAMGINGSLRITALWSNDGTAIYNKFLRVYLGGQLLFNVGNSVNTLTQSLIIIRNRGVFNSQISFNGGNATGLGAILAGSSTATADMSAAQNLQIRGALSNDAASLQLEGYTVELINP